MSAKFTKEDLQKTATERNHTVIVFLTTEMSTAK